MVLVALVLMTLAPASQARAQSALDLTLELGFENRFLSGHWMPVTVTVESSQATAGELEVLYRQPDRSLSVHTMNVEIPGGGKKAFDLVIPAPFEEGPVTARIVDDDEILGSVELAPLRLREEALVGVLGQAPPESMESITAEPAGVEVVPAELRLEHLDLGSPALESLSYVAADSADLDALTSEQQQALLDWATTGGRLFVASNDPASLTWPKAASQIEWAPSGDSVESAGRVLAQGRVGSVRVGLGRLLVTAGEVATLPRGLYEEALTPGAITTQGGGRGEFFGDFGSSAEGELVQALKGSGADLQLSWFVGFLILYLILVGPVNYFVLKKRGRKEMLWVTIPVLAILFSGIAYGLARGSRGDLVVRTAGIVFADEYGNRGRAIASVSSGTGGERTIEFPTKAAVAPTFLPFFGSSQQGSTRVTAEGAEVTIDTAPFGSHVARGTVAGFQGYLEAKVSNENGRLSYSIINRTPYDVTDLVVLYAQGSVEAGDLPSGEVARGQFDAPRQEFRFRPTMGGALRRSLDAELRAQVGHSSFSAPYVVGNVLGFDPGIKLEGRANADVARFMVASPAQVEIDEGGQIPAYAGQVRLVSLDGFAQQYNTGILSLEGFRQAVFVYEPPDGVGTRQIRGATLNFRSNGPPQEIQRFDWNQDRWVVVEGDEPNRLNASLPASTFSASGEAYFRLEPNRHGFAEIGLFNVEAEVR